MAAGQHLLTPMLAEMEKVVINSSLKHTCIKAFSCSFILGTLCGDNKIIELLHYLVILDNVSVYVNVHLYIITIIGIYYNDDTTHDD